MTAPAPARRLAGLLTAHGWTAVLTPGAGTVQATTLGDPRGDGTRPRLVVDAPCTSCAVRATHPDGRGLAAVWCSTRTTAKGAPSWKLDQAWTWTWCADPACRYAGRPHPDALPRPVASGELADVATAGSVLAEVYGLEVAA